MRKLAKMMAVLLILSLTACGGRDNSQGDSSTVEGSSSTQVDTGIQEAGEEESLQTQSAKKVQEERPQEGKSEASKSKEVKVKEALSVSIKLPAKMHEGAAKEEITAKNSDDYQATQNSDGSVTIKMTEMKHKEVMAQYKKSITESFEHLLSGEAESLKSITPNGDFTEVTIGVDKGKYKNGEEDEAIQMVVRMSCSVYQLFKGIEIEDQKTVIVVRDESTKEIICTKNYKGIDQ